MSQVQSNIVINVTGNSVQQIQQIQNGLGGATTMANQFSTAIGRIGGQAFAFQNISNSLRGMQQVMGTFSTPLIEFDQKSREMQAITNSSTEQVEKLNKKAKDLAETFGTSASANIDMFKVALSRLTPELGTSENFMVKFGETANMLSRTMYGDVEGATTAITTAMNQYGVDLSNPIEATAKMTEFTDKLAKSAQIGAVEMPALTQALNQTGSLAKSAGMDISELASMMQVAGKFTEQGTIGYALRDIMMEMQKGDFIPKEIRERMESLGLSTSKLADSSVSLKDKLLELRQFQQGDRAAFNEMFGRYANVANGLVNNISLYDDYIAKTQEFGGALKEQSDIIGESYGNKLAMAEQTLTNFKITIGEATGMFFPYAEAMAGGLAGTLDFMSGLNQTRELLKALTLIEFKKIVMDGWAAISTWTLTGAMQALNIVIMENPIAIAIVALAALTAGLVYCWNHFEGFRKFLFGLWESFKQVFSNIGRFFGQIFSPIAETIAAFQKGDWVGVGIGAAKLGVNLATAPLQFAKFVMDGELTKGVVAANQKGRAIGAASFEADQQKKGASQEAGGKSVSSPANLIKAAGDKADAKDSKKTADGKSTGGSGGGSGVRNVSVVINGLMKDIVIQTSNIKEGSQEIKRLIMEAVVAAVSDAEVALG